MQVEHFFLVPRYASSDLKIGQDQFCVCIWVEQLSLLLFRLSFLKSSLNILFEKDIESAQILTNIAKWNKTEEDVDSFNRCHKSLSKLLLQSNLRDISLNMFIWMWFRWRSLIANETRDHLFYIYILIWGMFKTICADSFPNPVNLTFSRVKIDYSGSNRNEIALTTRITQDSINTPCAFDFIFHNTTAHVFLQYRPATYTTKLSNIFTFIQNQKSNISSLRSKAINIYVERSPVSSSYTVLSEPVCFVLLLFFSSPRSAHTN